MDVHAAGLGSTEGKRILLDCGPSPRGWHRIESFLRCPQLYAWRHVAANHTPPSQPLVLGSLTHIGLAHHYARLREVQRRGDPDLYYGVHDAIDEAAARHGGLWLKLAPQVRETVGAYIAHYAEREHFKVLHVEELFHAEFNGWPFTARVDLVYEDAYGRVWLCDHKGTGYIEAKHPRFYSISGQFLAYRWLGTGAYGDRFGGVVLNMVQWSTPHKFERPPLDPAPALFAKFPQIVADAEAGIARIAAEGRKTEDWPAAANELTCVHRYGACDYLEKCKWGTNLK